MICVVCSQKYIVHLNDSYVSKTCSYKCHGVNSVRTQKNKFTKPELIVKDYLEYCNVQFEFQKDIINKFVVDFYIKELNLVIEVLGDYWHGNPSKYGDGKIPLSEMQIRAMKRDQNKREQLLKNGYNLLMIWESDIYNDISKLLDSYIIRRD